MFNSEKIIKIEYDSEDPENAVLMLADLITAAPVVYKMQQKEKVQYYDIAISFDTETTSYVDPAGVTKSAWVYAWMIGVENRIVLGRDIDDYKEFMNKLAKELKHRIIIFVHNLAFDFQFIRKLWQWENVFATDTYKPIYAVQQGGKIEYRCSYFQSGKSLQMIGEDLGNRTDIRKAVGDLDYTQIRTPETPLTEEEKGYCFNDIAVLNCYIDKCREQDGNVAKIQLTKTGYVREDVREWCLRKGYKKGYNAMIHNALTLSVEEYAELKAAFQGGFTHANRNYTALVCENVTSYDFTSSYPTVMISDYYPMSAGIVTRPQNKLEFKGLLNRYCCLFEIEMKNVKLKDTTPDTPLSKSKCRDIKGGKYDNGRVLEAESLKTTITEIDFQILEYAYKFEYDAPERVRIYNRGYLPQPIIEKVLEYYADKTQLKGVTGQEDRYMLAKGNLNSIYGMMVQDALTEDIIYTMTEKPWVKMPIDFESIDKYNNNKKRFLFYPWGVWITAHARYNLWTGISACGSDYIYSDTDSIKIMNAEKHQDYINKYNQRIQEKIKACLDHYGLDVNLASPKTVKGVEKPLGVWDNEYGINGIQYFKTLGAKRYVMIHDNDILQYTVAGISKKAIGLYSLKQCGIEYYINKEGIKINADRKQIKQLLKTFNNGLTIPAGESGKLTHYYIDETADIFVTDYTGKQAKIRSYSGVCLVAQPFSIDLSTDYFDMLLGMGRDSIFARR